MQIRDPRTIEELTEKSTQPSARFGSDQVAFRIAPEYRVILHGRCGRSPQPERRRSSALIDYLPGVAGRTSSHSGRRGGGRLRILILVLISVRNQPILSSRSSLTPGGCRENDAISQYKLREIDGGSTPPAAFVLQNCALRACGNRRVSRRSPPRARARRTGTSVHYLNYGAFRSCARAGSMWATAHGLSTSF